MIISQKVMRKNLINRNRNSKQDCIQKFESKVFRDLFIINTTFNVKIIIIE